LHPDFRDQYACARENQQDHCADENIEIADDACKHWIERKRRDGTVEIVLNREHVERSKLRVQARQWHMSKLAPKKYGERVGVEHSGTISHEHELSVRMDNAIKRLDETPTIDVAPGVKAEPVPALNQKTRP
jgi:hypothetical protein